jgi:hypothetical protein
LGSGAGEGFPLLLLPTFLGLDFEYESNARSVIAALPGQSGVCISNRGDTPMSDSDHRTPIMPPQREAREVIYAFGRSTVGDFIAAIDKNGLCAILFGDDHADLLDELRDALPDRNLTEACPTYGGFLASAGVLTMKMRLLMGCVFAALPTPLSAAIPPRSSESALVMPTSPACSKYDGGIGATKVCNEPCPS